jgi:hypothetical protein
MARYTIGVHDGAGVFYELGGVCGGEIKIIATYFSSAAFISKSVISCG